MSPIWIYVASRLRERDNDRWRGPELERLEDVSERLRLCSL